MYSFGPQDSPLQSQCSLLMVYLCRSIIAKCVLQEPAIHCNTQEKKFFNMRGPISTHYITYSRCVRMLLNAGDVTALKGLNLRKCEHIVEFLIIISTLTSSIYYTFYVLLCITIA